MATDNPLEGLARFALETRWKDLPPPIVHETKMDLDGLYRLRPRSTDHR